MTEYHKYVFDADARKFVGDFDSMYRDEDAGGFDSWHQENLNHRTKRIAQAVLADYNFSRIVDAGCGKGNFTHTLKKQNNSVLGVDISPEAVKKAVARFPEVVFRAGQISDIPRFQKELGWPKADLLVAMEILSYVSEWREVLRESASWTDWIFISLYIPENPIGFVKSYEDLVGEARRSYAPIQELYSLSDRALYWFGESRLRKQV